MTWEETTVPVVRRAGSVSSLVRFAAGEVCVVEVSASDGTQVRGEGPDLFEALVAVRRFLEAGGTRLACNGSRRDVFPSAMLRQASGGRRAYVLEMPRTTARPVTVDIFEVAPESAALATVDEQRAWFEQWQQAGAGESS
jgi:hypothetical protein